MLFVACWASRNLRGPVSALRDVIVGEPHQGGALEAPPVAPSLLPLQGMTRVLRALPAIYRFRHGAKISTLRLVLYALFGSVASGTFHLGLSTLNLVMATTWLLFASVLNDYYDYRLLGEQNALGIAVASGQLRLRRLWLLATIPAAASLSLFGLLWLCPVTRLSLSVWTVVILLGTLYSLPPIRLKERRVFGILTTPVCLFGLFLESFTLLRLPDPRGWLVAGLVFLFVWYLECLHLVDDSLQPHEFKKAGTAQAMAWLRRVALLGLFASLAASVFAPLLLASALAWTLRVRASRRLRVADVSLARRNLWHPIWQLEDFVVYGFWGLIRTLSELG